jgi:hypothetical protein
MNDNDIVWENALKASKLEVHDVCIASYVKKKKTTK